jgi:hypothetical protein
MAKGMSLPLRANGRGGARLIYGSAYARQTILAGLTPNTSRNPFQAGEGVEVGISEKVVFAVNAPGAQAQARREVRAFFARARVEDIATLVPGTEGLAFDDTGAELVAQIRYIELEADREDVVESDLKTPYYGLTGNVGGTV